MKKEFIPYEQALALKELGFDEPCLGLFKFDNLSLDYPYLTNTGLSNSGLDKYCSAPTFSQAFRWFREKYGLFHSITEYNKDGSLIIEISKDRVEIFRKMTNFDFTEYKEAELECLKKLIEIVKQK